MQGALMLLDQLIYLRAGFSLGAWRGRLLALVRLNSNVLRSNDFRLPILRHAAPPVSPVGVAGLYRFAARSLVLEAKFLDSRRFLTTVPMRRLVSTTCLEA